MGELRNLAGPGLLRANLVRIFSGPIGIAVVRKYELELILLLLLVFIYLYSYSYSYSY